MLSKKENRDEQVILRDLYRDKESIYSDVFAYFLLNLILSSQTYRSDFWRNQKPMYVEEGERVTRRMSMMEDTQTRMKRGPDKSALFTIRLNI